MVSRRTHRRSWSQRWAVAEVFAGVGSVAEGFRSGGGFDVAYLNDIDSAARDTYRENYGLEVSYDLRDAREVTGKMIRDRADGRPVAGLLGCPPCQGWSTAGQRLSDDERNRLLGEFFRLVDEIRPLFFVMENVPAVSDRAELRAALERLSRRYRVWSGVLNAASYGLPQSRQRTLVIAYRRDTGSTPAPPPPTHAGKRRLWDYRSESLCKPSKDNLDALLGAAPRQGRPGAAAAYTMQGLYPDDLSALRNFVTVGEAIRDLDPEAEQGASDYARSLGGGWFPAANHQPWGHGKAFMERMATVEEGRRPPAEASNGKRYYSQAYARLHRRGLARTITTNFHNPGCGRFLHYARPRSLTVREAARLQGFDDGFHFIQHPSWQERLIGNAFPPLWAYHIARHAADQLAEVLAA
jgi:DNA (cytosine-5)-methyltransferase 1